MIDDPEISADGDIGVWPATNERLGRWLAGQVIVEATEDYDDIVLKLSSGLTVTLCWDEPNGAGIRAQIGAKS